MPESSARKTPLDRHPLSEFELDLSSQMIAIGLDNAFPSCDCGGVRRVLSSWKREEYIIRRYRCKECGSEGKSIEINADAFMDLIECINWRKGNEPN